MISKRIFLIALLFAVLATPLALREAHSLNVGAEAVENYSACGSSAGNLSYTNDQASMFVSKMSSLGHTKKFLYLDSNAWNRDMVEDSLSGTDYYTSDSTEIMLISGHGGGASGGTYYGYLCPSSGWPRQNYNTGETYLGENYGTYLGKLRFLILCTCYSVNPSNAASVWRPVFARGIYFSYVMGYSGTSADSWLTTEVGRDFAQKAGAEGWTLKQAWFWAIEDWWVNDTGAVVSRGTTESDAISNRDTYKLNTYKTHSYPSWIAWAWHAG